jgi:hypothetical protein
LPSEIRLEVYTRKVHIAHPLNQLSAALSVRSDYMNRHRLGQFLAGSFPTKGAAAQRCVDSLVQFFKDR